ncbi:MAG: FAD-binding oxidoreductase [Rhodospirillaceae bacterium]|nr:FAD-binding oxidoreductase [Rhodospirillaceae bacterium]
MTIPTLPAFDDIVGRDGVITDEAERIYYSQDYYRQGSTTLAVIRPSSIAQLAATVARATTHGLAVYPRGAGYSYTDAYLPTKPGITLDMRSMSRILDINTTDMFVTVEAGCSWAALDSALEPHGVRAPFWGPLSGLRATIGGAVSQGAISLGSGKYGVSAESVLSLDVVTADGKIIKTGSDGQPNHSPFFRNYGPDLTGLFCGDSGALGLKAHVTLRLMRRPNVNQGLAFGFTSMEGLVQASAAVAQEGLVSESLGLPARVVGLRSSSGGLADDLRTLWTVAKAQANPIDAIVQVAKIAVAGRRFFANLEQTLNVVVEGPNAESVKGQARAVRKAVGNIGVEIANTVPTVLRAMPFRDHDMVSHTGQRQLPPSTILPFSKVMAFHTAFTARVAAHAAEMTRHGMSVLPVFSTVGTNGFLYEPVIAWNDAPDEFHRRHSAKITIEKAKDFRNNPDARDLAQTIRGYMIDCAYAHGGVHLQIGKVYPYLRDRNPAAVAAVKALKALVDPKNLINPGALGLPG